MRKGSSPAEGKPSKVYDHADDPVFRHITVHEAMLVKELGSLKESAIRELLEKRQSSIDARVRNDIDHKLKLLGCATADAEASLQNTKTCATWHKPGHNTRTCPDIKKTVNGS